MRVQVFRTGSTVPLGECDINDGEPTPQIGDHVKVALKADEMYWEAGEVYKREWSISPNGVQLNIRIQ